MSSRSSRRCTTRRDELAAARVARAPPAPTPQVIVVDTDSARRRAGVAARPGRGRERRDNPGFGAANNAGVARADARGDACCSTPTSSCSTAGSTRLAALAAGRDALFVPRLLNADGSVQRSAHPLPGTAVGAAARARAPAACRCAAAEPWRVARAAHVGWAIAAALAARRSRCARLGPFDPAAFLFYEDLDLCLRARAAGVPTVLHPEVELRTPAATPTSAGAEPTCSRGAGARSSARTSGPRALRWRRRRPVAEFAARSWRGRDRARLRRCAPRRG